MVLPQGPPAEWKNDPQLKLNLPQLKNLLSQDLKSIVNVMR
jgi:hypothetical protein